jgi:hypothetical protein
MFVWERFALSALVLGLSTWQVNGQVAGQPAAQEAKLAFKPKLELKWPGKPEESSQVIKDGSFEQKDYTAHFVLKRATGNISFWASVAELPIKEMRENPKVALAAYVLAFKKDETSRKEIEHGPKKFPGFEIASRTKFGFDRKVVVIAGQRIYQISVQSRDEDLLKIEEVKAFMKSLAIKD